MGGIVFMIKDLRKLNISFVMLAALSILTTYSIAAQDVPPDCVPVYQKLLDNRNGPDLDKYRTALAAGKEYLTKCGSVGGEGVKAKEYVTKQIPRLTEAVRISELAERFNLSVPAKNWDEVMVSGKELLATKHPGSLDIMIVLASVGYTNAVATPPVDKYNSDSLEFARSVLKKLEEGATTENYGAYQFGYKTKTCPDGKANTISWMNYTIGFITYSRLKQQAGAVPYLYKALQSGCELKDAPQIYMTFGSWYTDEAIKLNKVREQKIKAAGDQETEETKAGTALIYGYLDRAIDAYARAHQYSAPGPNRDAIYIRLQGLFDTRFDGSHAALDKFLAEAANKPFVDPATPVSPVKVPPPVQPATVPNVAPKRP
jgi:hypothetical protein